MIHRARPGTSERRSKRHWTEVIGTQDKKCMVVVKEKDARHKGNLKEHEEPKEELVDRDVKILIFS